MYARKVSLCLKPDAVGQFILKMEYEVLPLFRKQQGFLDQLVFSETSNEIYFFSFWETSEDAEHYDRATLPRLKEIPAGVIDGVLRGHNFAGLRGRLAGNEKGRGSRRALPALSKGISL